MKNTWQGMILPSRLEFLSNAHDFWPDSTTTSDPFFANSLAAPAGNKGEVRSMAFFEEICLCTSRKSVAKKPCDAMKNDSRILLDALCDGTPFLCTPGHVICGLFHHTFCDSSSKSSDRHKPLRSRMVLCEKNITPQQSLFLIRTPIPRNVTHVARRRGSSSSTWSLSHCKPRKLTPPARNMGLGISAPHTC